MAQQACNNIFKSGNVDDRQQDWNPPFFPFANHPVNAFFFTWKQATLIDPSASSRSK
jgi:hypothetical protein